MEQFCDHKNNILGYDLRRLPLRQPIYHGFFPYKYDSVNWNVKRNKLSSLCMLIRQD